MFVSDDDFETVAHSDRNIPLGFFSKFWELQVGIVFVTVIFVYFFSCLAVKYSFYCISAVVIGPTLRVLSFHKSNYSNSQRFLQRDCGYPM